MQPLHLLNPSPVSPEHARHLVSPCCSTDAHSTITLCERFIGALTPPKVRVDELCVGVPDLCANALRLFHFVAVPLFGNRLSFRCDEFAPSPDLVLRPVQLALARFEQLHQIRQRQLLQ